MISILTDEQAKGLLKNAYMEALTELKKDKEPTYYSPAQLSEKFPFSEWTFQKWIKEGKFGISNHGKMMATYKEVETYLTGRK